jgi:hypothetical protein
MAFNTTKSAVMIGVLHIALSSFAPLSSFTMFKRIDLPKHDLHRYKSTKGYRSPANLRAITSSPTHLNRERAFARIAGKTLLIATAGLRTLQLVEIPLSVIQGSTGCRNAVFGDTSLFRPTELLGALAKDVPGPLIAKAA